MVGAILTPTPVPIGLILLTIGSYAGAVRPGLFRALARAIRTDVRMIAPCDAIMEISAYHQKDD
ncbi:MAG: hypothetical protein R3C42_09075 [Parvularculaceae bacterium]